MPLRPIARVAAGAALLLVAPWALGAQLMPMPAARRADPVAHISINPVAPLALSFYADAERRVADLQTIGIGVGFTNLPDEDALLSVDAKYRFWLGEQEFQGWSIAPTIGLSRFSEEQSCGFGLCAGGSDVRSTIKGAFGTQVDYTWRARRGAVAVTAGIGAKRFFGGDNDLVGVTFLPTARLSLGVLF